MSTLLSLYSAGLAHIRCKSLTDIILHYITQTGAECSWTQTTPMIQEISKLINSVTDCIRH